MSTCNQPVGLANTRISTNYDAQKSPGSLMGTDIDPGGQLEADNKLQSLQLTASNAPEQGVARQPNRSRFNLYEREKG